MPITLYGIKNCDTMRKARAWLDARGIDYRLHDYKTAGIEPDRLAYWCHSLGWERVINRAGNTFRKLPDADKRGLDERAALRHMLAQPSMIKRPMLEIGDALIVGFDPVAYGKAFAHTPK